MIAGDTLSSFIRVPFFFLIAFLWMVLIFLHSVLFFFYHSFLSHANFPEKGFFLINFDSFAILRKSVGHNLENALRISVSNANFRIKRTGLQLLKINFKKVSKVEKMSLL